MCLARRPREQSVSRCLCLLTERHSTGIFPIVIYVWICGVQNQIDKSSAWSRCGGHSIGGSQYHSSRYVLITASFHCTHTVALRSIRVSLVLNGMDDRLADVHRLCIAHLYGGGPELYVSPSLVPTSKHPLTSVFPMEAGSSTSFFLSGCPPGQHPASPRFLLSLLATAVFLSITPLASQAMSYILNTIGPYTVSRYLGFALGHGIGEPEDGEPEAAVGLEGVAELLHDEEDSILEVDESTAETPKALSVVNPMEKLKGPDLQKDGASELDVQKEDPSEGDSSGSSIFSSTSRASEHHFFYGVVSDKIGETSACWLVRWGIDMLHYELQLISKDTPDVAQATALAGTRKRASTVPGPTGAGSSSTRASGMRPNIKYNVPVIWRRGGLPARWVRGLLSSDMLFVSGEKERYDIARLVVELRRAEGIIEEEEAEYDVLFASGIYYANMV